MKTDKEKPTKKKKYLEFFTGFLLVLVVILSKQLFYKNTYDELERRLANNYYSADNIEMAIRNKLGAATEEGDSQNVFITENFDNYVYQLVLDDINTYESGIEPDYPIEDEKCLDVAIDLLH